VSAFVSDGVSTPEPASAGVTIERVTRTPCAWCGTAIEPRPRGRPARFCSRSCRQRDYELRTAAARYGADVAAGRIHQEPAERVIERTVLAKHPTRPADWEAALAELAEQLRTGRIDPAHHDRIRAALQPVRAALDGYQSRPATRSVPAPAGRSHSRSASPAAQLGAGAEDVLTYLRHTPGRTSLERIAAVTGHHIDAIRTALAALAAASAVTVYRQHAGGHPIPIDPYALSPHAGFHADPAGS
jgi:endogenous inhibitor of DNA gyrase (YacG/DUF329 family)